MTSFSLKYQSRVLVALPSDTISSKWLVGTTVLREENEVSSLVLLRVLEITM